MYFIAILQKQRTTHLYKKPGYTFNLLWHPSTGTQQKVYTKLAFFPRCVVFCYTTQPGLKSYRKPRRGNYTRRGSRGSRRPTAHGKSNYTILFFPGVVVPPFPSQSGYQTTRAGNENNTITRHTAEPVALYSREPLVTPTPPPEPTGTGERLTHTGNPRRVSCIVLHRQPTPGHSRHYTSFAAHGAHRGTRNPGTTARQNPPKPAFLPRCCVATAPKYKTTTPGTRCNYNVFLCVRVFFRSREPGRGVLCTIDTNHHTGELGPGAIDGTNTAPPRHSGLTTPAGVVPRLV